MELVTKRSKKISEAHFLYAYPSIKDCLNGLVLRSLCFPFLVIASVIFFQSSSALAQEGCPPLFSRMEALSSEARSAQRAWSPANFTKASEHNDNAFKYIVHAGPNVASDGADPVISFAQRVRNSDFNNEGFFSSSIISEKHTGTFSWSGVILEMPEEKIIAATPVDMVSTGADKLSLEQGMKRFAKGTLPAPSAILNEASGGTGFFNSDLSWTEVLVYGKAPSQGRIKVSGFFAHKDSLGVPILAPARTEKLIVTAKEVGVPFVLIPPPKGNFVLKVRMIGERKPVGAQFMTDYGPQRVEFFGSESAVRSIFAQAKLQGVKVRLVDETGGPVSALADENLFKGGWLDRWKSSQPTMLPKGTSSFDIRFSP